MHVLVADLDEHRARVGQQLARQQEPVAEIREVRVDAQLPGVAVGADLLGLAGERAVVAVLDVALVRPRLEVRVVVDAVGRVDVHALDLAGHPLAPQQRVHDQQRVAQDQPVRPVHLVLVEGQLLVEAELRVGEERPLDLLAPHGPEDRGGRHALVDVEADGVDVEAGVLGLAGPDQLGVQVGVVGVGHPLRDRAILRRDARFGDVGPRRVGVAVVADAVLVDGRGRARLRAG